MAGTAVPKTGAIAPKVVGFLLFDGFQPIDLAGPWQALETANEEAGREAYVLRTIGVAEMARSAGAGLRVAVDHRLAEAPAVDTLVVPGGPGVYAACEDPLLTTWLREVDARTARTCSVCTGAFLLAQAGLLDGRPVSTHWRSAARLQERFPAVQVDDDRIFCESGKYWTTAGVTAGIDFALALIERDLGPAAAQGVARRLVVYLRRPGGQRQYSQTLRAQDQASAPFRELMEQLQAGLERNWQVEDMAALCNMSRRTFQRKFTLQFGMPPMEALKRLRCERAAILSAPGALSGKQIRRETGVRPA